MVKFSKSKTDPKRCYIKPCTMKIKNSKHSVHLQKYHRLRSFHFSLLDQTIIYQDHDKSRVKR